MINKPKDYTVKIRGALKSTKGFSLLGDKILVQYYPQAEISKGGIVLTGGLDQRGSLTERKYEWCEVIITGRGYYDETTGEEVPLEFNEGDVLLVNPAGLTKFPVFGGVVAGKETGGIGLISDSDVAMKFSSVEEAMTCFGRME